MTDHDPMCPFAGDDRPLVRPLPEKCEYCRSISQVRADERERIAQDVAGMRRTIDQCVTGWQLPRDVVRSLYASADRIALRAGSAE